MRDLYDILGEVDKLTDDGQRALHAMIDRTSDLKQLPLIARKIMQVIENPKSTAADLERVVHSDQALTVKILKIANSSFYGLLRKVNTLQRAILVVGFKAIKDIAVSTAILNMYRTSDPISIKLWEHAVGSGICARMLSLEFESADTEESFIGGLLHDLGKSLILRANPNEAKRVYTLSQKGDTREELGLERDLFGFCHTHAGGVLARTWNLAPSLEAMMRCHHLVPEVLNKDIETPLKTNIAIVAYADRFCRRLGIGYDAPDPQLDMGNCPEAEFLKIPLERVNEMLEELKASFHEESQSFV